MMAVPVVTPVTIPVGSTVAVAVLLLLHVPPVVVFVKVVVDVGHTENVPAMETGVPVTMTVCVASVPQPVV